MNILLIFSIAIAPLLSQVSDSLTVAVVKPLAKIYENPDSKSAILQKLKKGTSVIVLSEQNDKFIRVQYDGEIGWLKIKRIKNYKEIQEIISQHNLASDEAPIIALDKPDLPEKGKKAVKDSPIPAPVEETPKTKIKKINNYEAIKQTPPIAPQNVLKPENKSEDNSVGSRRMISIYLPLSILLNAILFVFLVRYFILHRQIKMKYSPVIDLEAEVSRIQNERDALSLEFQNLDSAFQSKENELNTQYVGKRKLFEQLLAEIRLVEEDLEFISFGVYKPRYDFESAARYKKEIDRIRLDQKNMIKNKTAIVCNTQWEVGGSKREGTKMINRLKKLMMRAFNNECDSASLKVKWNNFDNMAARINKSFEAINKLGEVNNTFIQTQYLRSKIEELSLVHEYHEKVQEEREEQRRIREQIREEEKVAKEIEKALKDADFEEKRYQKALDEVRKELDVAKGKELDELNKSIELLQAKLEESIQSKERAISRAQQTKSGHVYVISNIGSFGEDVFKIGMTRRLEPLDRVRELGDASVPFRFDIHAMIYSEDAPALENQLHRQFDSKRLNMVNSRKEFFRVNLSEIQSTVVKNHGEIEFTKLAEAREYRETMALINTETDNGKLDQNIAEKFPASL